MKVDFKPLVKQHECLTYLKNNEINEVLFGGSAGCSKSYTICAWLIMNCELLPGTRWLLGRAVLSALKKSTLNTFFEVAKDFKVFHHFKF